jgi:hypothetical protein
MRPDFLPARNLLDREMKASISNPAITNNKKSADVLSQQTQQLIWQKVAGDARGLNQYLFLCTAKFLGERGGKDMRRVQENHLLLKYMRCKAG